MWTRMLLVGWILMRKPYNICPLDGSYISTSLRIRLSKELGFEPIIDKSTGKITKMIVSEYISLFFPSSCLMAKCSK
jgi:hypothetical protein